MSSVQSESVRPVDGEVSLFKTPSGQNSIMNHPIWERFRKLGIPCFVADGAPMRHNRPRPPAVGEGSISCLGIPDKVADIIDVYLANHLMPHGRVGDALHLALASYHKCDFLLTWNCRHIANANKFEHIRILNSRLGLFVPALVTPIELCMEEST
jgi:hypothetical protein